MTSQRKLGIIAGGGSIPKMLIEHCAAQGRDFFVLAIEGNADKALITDDIPHQWIRIGQAGTGFKRFAAGATNDRLPVLGMNLFLHVTSPLSNHSTICG